MNLYSNESRAVETPKHICMCKSPHSAFHSFSTAYIDMQLLFCRIGLVTDAARLSILLSRTWSGNDWCYLVSGLGVHIAHHFHRDLAHFHSVDCIS